MVVLFVKKTIILILIPLLLVVTAQICLKNPKTRELFTDIEKYENITYPGIPSGKMPEISFYADDKAEILFNGKTIAVSDKNKTTVTVNCNGVFEIKNLSDSNIKVTVDYDTTLMSVDVKATEFGLGVTPICSVRLHRP